MGIGSSKAHRAAGSGDTETLAEEWAKDHDIVQLHNNEMYYPLHAAAMFGHVDCVVFLLAKGADINAKNIDSATPLLLAASRGHLDVVRILCDNGALINFPSRRSHTPLIAALYHRQEAVALELIIRGADLDYTTTRGDTAAQIARRMGMMNVLRMIKAAKQGDLKERLAAARESGRDIVLPTVDDDEKAAELVAVGSGGSHGSDEEQAPSLARVASRIATGEPACLVCLKSACDIVLLPCRHLCVCRLCASSFDMNKRLRCPVCRQRVEEVKPVGETQHVTARAE